MTMKAIILALFLAAGGYCNAQSAPEFYLGFDRNQYPGDQNLRALRQTFAFAGYWLNNPPGEKSNHWLGKREALNSAGFGFLVLFNGRLYAELKSVEQARHLGARDARSAAAAARQEGFPAATVIFLDQEQGGRMLPGQKAYIYAWVDAIKAAGFGAGIYCSGIAAADDENVITAEDIQKNARGRDIDYFVTNDECPPSPGCAFHTISPRKSGIGFAEVWQFAQSPRRPEYTKGCSASYSADGNCYPPRVGEKLHVDVDAADSADPSHGRRYEFHL
jgi:hypothetical protein